MNFYYFGNKIGNIGAKYLGLGLSKLNKLTYLYLFLVIFLFYSLYYLLVLVGIILIIIKLEILELNI